jgi:NAD+ diphosphatase
MIYKYCPYCKGTLIKKSYEYTCTECGKKVYLNPAPCVSVIPIKDNKILLSIRKIEPYKGEVDIIGGFIIPGETVEEAGIRECKEETNLDIKIRDLIGIYPDVYAEDDKPTINIQYTAEIIDGEISASDDVEKLIWVEINDIPNLKFEGFENTKRTLEEIYKLSRSGR